MRPDEETALAEIEREKRKKERLKTAGGIALDIGSTAMGIGVASRIAPLLNSYIPKGLALKGINKISPQLGKFLKEGQDAGLDLEEGFNFLREKLNLGGAKQEQKHPELEQKKASQAGGPLELIAGYSPELADMIMEKVQQGKSPEEAAMIAEVSAPKEVLQAIEKDSGEKFIDLILRLLGGKSATQGQSKLPQLGKQIGTPMQRKQNPQMGGGMQPDLMAALQKIQQVIK